MLQLKVTPVVGLPQFTGWSQVAESTASASSRLVCVFAIAGKHAGNVGRDINEKISDFYFYDVEQLHDFLQQLVAYVHDNECKIYFSCAVLNTTRSVFATYGGSVFLRRGEKAGKILVSDFNIKVVEGTYRPDDVFVLTTLQADQFLSEIQQKFIQGYDTDIIITSVVPGLHAQKDSSLSALVFVTKDVETEEQKGVQAHKDEEAPFFETESEEESVYLDEKHKDVTDNKDVSSLDDPKELRAHEQQNLRAVEHAGTIDKKPTGGFSASMKVSIDESPVTMFFQKFFNYLKRLIFLFLKLLKTLITMLISLFKKIKVSKFKHFFMNIRENGVKSIWQKKQVYLSQEQSRKNRTKLFFGIIALLIIATLGGYFWYQRNQQKETVTALLGPIESEFVTAKENLETDPIVTREQITQTIMKIEKLEEDNQKNAYVSLLTDKKQELQNYLVEISGKKEISELEVFYDLRLVKSDFIASGIDIRSGKLLIFDKDMKQVVLLSHDSKQVDARDFSNRELFKSGVLNDEYVFLLTDGIYKFDFSKESDLVEVRNLGDSNRNATLVAAYDRFVYVVNPEKRNIYRYAETEDGYSEPVGWMKSATGIRYDEIRSIAVDGDVWLTTSDGQLKKFTSGKEEAFSIRGLETQFESDIYVYTHGDLEKLYILDSQNNRVVVLDKNGDFIKEFKSISLGAANGLAVSEDLGKIFAVSGSILYQISL